MNLDSNLVWAFALFSLVGLMIETNRTHKFVTLRENMVNSDMGKFKEEDFNWKENPSILLTIYLYYSFLDGNNSLIEIEKSYLNEELKHNLQN